MNYVNSDQPYYFRPTAKVIQIGMQKVFFLGGARILYFSGDVVKRTINPLVVCLNTGLIINNFFTDPTLLCEAVDVLNSLNSNCLLQGVPPQTVQPEIRNYLTLRFSPLKYSKYSINRQLNNFSKINFFLPDRGDFFTGGDTFFGVEYATYSNDDQKLVSGADNVCFCSNNEFVNVQFSCAAHGILDVHISKIIKKSSALIQNTKIITGLDFSLLAHCILLALAGVTPPKLIRRSYDNSFLGTVNPDLLSGKKYFDSHDVKNQFGHYKAINEMCLFSTGTTFQYGKIRRISPSAGDLRTVHCVYLSNEIEGEIGVWVMVAGCGFLEKISIIRDQDLYSFIKNTAGILIFVTTAGGLRIKYKELAYRLAFYDSGIAVGYAKRLAGRDSILTENLGLDTIQKISNKLSFISKDHDAFISGGLVLVENLGEDELRKSYPSKDFWLSAMLTRQSVRRFDSAVPENSELDVLEGRYLDVENVFSEMDMDMDALSPMLIRIQRVESLDVEFNIRIINVSTGSIVKSYSHKSFASQFACIIRQQDLAQAPLVYLVAYKCLSQDLFPDELRWKCTSETLASLWLLAESCGLRGTLCGDTYIAGLANDLKPYDADNLSLCLGRPTRQNT